MKRFAEVVYWVKCNPLTPEHIDCATAVMLKILDGKCKMKAEEKQVMTHLYHAVKTQPGVLLGADMHHLIAAAQDKIDEAMRDAIYEQRVLAETMISRPVMKAFKKLIRNRGLFAGNDNRVQVAGIVIDDTSMSATHY